jgi:hypothetical protein
MDLSNFFGGEVLSTLNAVLLKYTGFIAEDVLFGLTLALAAFLAGRLATAKKSKDHESVGMALMFVLAIITIFYMAARDFVWYQIGLYGFGLLSGYLLGIFTWNDTRLVRTPSDLPMEGEYEL